MRWVPRGLKVLVTVVVGLFLTLAFVLPLFRVAFEIKSGDFWRAFLSSQSLSIVKLTVFQALLSTVLSLGLGLGIGLKIWRNTKTDFLLLIPFGIPTVIAATAWAGILGRSGFNLSSVILAHVFYNAPWVALGVAQARRRLPAVQWEAALTLGASKMQWLKFIVWPWVRGSFVSTGLQVFCFCCMSFALVMILGGGPPVQTLEVGIYASLRMGEPNLSQAAALALWQLILMAVPTGLLLKSSRNTAVSVQSVHHTAPDQGKALDWLLAGIFLLPILQIFSSISINGESGDFWSNLKSPFFQSAVLALGVSVFTTFMVVSILFVASAWGPRWRRWVLYVASIPAGVSILVLGLGVWMLYLNWIDLFSNSLIAWIAIGAIQSLTLLPMGLRLLSPVLESQDIRALEASWTLGQGWFLSFLKLEWPRWRGPIQSVLSLTAILSAGEVASVSLFYSEDRMTLPLVVSRWISQYRFEEAQAASQVLMILCVIFALCSLRLAHICGRRRS